MRMICYCAYFDCSTLSTNKDTRRRRIDFNVPVIMPIAAHARLVQNDASMTTFQDAYEQHTKAMGIDRDYPVIKFVDKIRSLNAEKGAVVSLHAPSKYDSLLTGT